MGGDDAGRQGIGWGLRCPRKAGADRCSLVPFVFSFSAAKKAAKKAASAAKASAAAAEASAAAETDRAAKIAKKERIAQAKAQRAAKAAAEQAAADEAAAQKAAAEKEAADKAQEEKVFVQVSRSWCPPPSPFRRELIVLSNQAAVQPKPEKTQSSNIQANGRGLLGYSSDNCGSSRASDNEPNGSLDFLNCGISRSNPSSGWVRSFPPRPRTLLTPRRSAEPSLRHHPRPPRLCLDRVRPRLQLGLAALRAVDPSVRKARSQHWNPPDHARRHRAPGVDLQQGRHRRRRRERRTFRSANPSSRPSLTLFPRCS